MNRDDLVEVYSTPNPSQAHLVRMQLEATGIAAVVLDDLILAGGAQVPHARVCVHQQNQTNAATIIEEWRQSEEKNRNPKRERGTDPPVPR